MSTVPATTEAVREPVISPVDRISEAMFGLLMALSFTGAVSVSESGNAEIHDLFVAALGCNLAWGLVDAVMYLVRTVTERGRTLTLVNSVRAAPDAQAGQAIVAQSLSKVVAHLVTPTEIEAIHGRIVALPSVPPRPTLVWNDLLAAVAIFLVVVVVTFPVVLPFAWMHDVGAAKNVSNGIALVLLFVGGLGLGRYAGYGSWKSGVLMAGVGAALVAAILALGG